ncbi:MAG: sigma-70 family RNA polymerase sigma factor [Thermoanaerobaculia bacterium]|jgi:RNA polymerase sigma factor (sigma-70 family)
MDRDTEIGGRDARFPATRLSVIDSLRSDDTETRARGCERLVSLYWKPLYKYVRIKWNRSNEDAKDLIQGFFALALERETLSSFDPSRAGFRTFLRLLLDRFASNELKGAARLKRGGAAVALDFDAAEAELARVASSRPDPEELLHREWVRSLFGACVERLCAELCESGRAQQFLVFETFDLEDGATRPTYREIAASLGIAETTVTNNLAAARRRFRAIVLETLREMTASDEEFRAEARAVLGIDP